MTEPCFDYHKIDTFDIWEYVREQYLLGNSSDDHISKLKERYEEVIIYTNGWQKKDKTTITISPFTDTKRFDSGEHKGYFDRNIRDLHNARTLKDQVALNYFMVRGEMYSFLQTIYINPNHKNFDFWFCLKLEQYSNGLKYVNQFLDSVLEELFNDDFSRFNEFLEVALVQFDTILSPALIRLVNKWGEGKNTLIIPSNSKLETTRWKYMTSTESTKISIGLELDLNDEGDEIPQENFNPLMGNVIERDIDWGDEIPEPESFTGPKPKIFIEEELHSKYDSFFSPRIKVNRDSQTTFNKTRLIFESFFKLLVDNGFLSKESNSSGQLFDLFTYKNISQKNIIKWKGTAYELKCFIKVIEKSTLCDHIGGLHKWVIAQKCFHCKIRGKDEGKIEKFTSISGAKKTNDDNSHKLKPIEGILTCFNL